MVPKSPDAERWHVARFQFNSSRGTSPEWHLDLLVAHLVVAPLIESIGMWRAHRRCGDDDTGHQFSFYFYTEPTHGASLISTIKSNQFVAQLRQTGKLTETEYCEGGQSLSWGTEDWETTIKNAWPYFIQGVSKAWLELIRQELGNEQFSTIDDAALNRFEVAHARISQRWRQSGGHAMLHQLNAMFGYDPVLVMPRCLELMPDYQLKMQF